MGGGGVGGFRESNKLNKVELIKCGGGGVAPSRPARGYGGAL